MNPEATNNAAGTTDQTANAVYTSQKESYSRRICHTLNLHNCVIEQSRI